MASPKPSVSPTSTKRFFSWNMWVLQNYNYIYIARISVLLQSAEVGLRCSDYFSAAHAGNWKSQGEYAISSGDIIIIHTHIVWALKG